LIVKTFLSHPDVIDAGIAIREHCKPVEGTGFFSYEEGWSDERIRTEAIGGRGSVHNISNLRLRLGMRLIALPQATPDARLTALEEQVAQLRHDLDAFVDEFKAG
jgi:hypothetical protein